MSVCLRCQKPGAQWVRVHLDVDTYAELCSPCREIWRERGIATTPVTGSLEPSDAATARSGGTSGDSSAAAAA